MLEEKGGAWPSYLKALAIYNAIMGIMIYSLFSIRVI